MHHMAIHIEDLINTRRIEVTNIMKGIGDIKHKIDYLETFVKSKPGAARLGSHAAARGKSVEDAPCHRLPPGPEPGPCGVTAPAAWCLVVGSCWAHRPELVLAGMVTGW